MAAPRFYFVRKNGQESGPYSVVQLAEQWKAGIITAADELRQDGGTGKWYPVREFSKQLDTGGKADSARRSSRKMGCFLLGLITFIVVVMVGGCPKEQKRTAAIAGFSGTSTATPPTTPGSSGTSTATPPTTPAEEEELRKAKERDARVDKLIAGVYSSPTGEPNYIKKLKDSPPPSPPASSSRTQIVRTGEVGILRAGSSSGDVVVGIDKAANDEITKMAVRQDREGFAGMVLSGRAFLVPAGTRVRMLDTFFTLGFLPTAAQVRILEGRFYGRDGVVPHEWVVPAPAGTTESPTPEAKRAQPVQSATPSKKPTRSRKP